MTNIDKSQVQPNVVLELRGQLDWFQTNNPTFFCFEDVPINVWKAQGFPDNALLAFGTCPAGVDGYWTFTEPPPELIASAVWKGQNVPLTFAGECPGECPTPVNPTAVPTATPASAAKRTPTATATPIPACTPTATATPTATGTPCTVTKSKTTYEGYVTNFYTNDTNFYCLNYQSHSVYIDPDDYYGLNVIQESCNGTTGTWIFQHPFFYTAVWKRRMVTLTYVPSDGKLLDTDKYEGQVTNFSTDDPVYTLCLNAGAFNVYFNSALNPADYRVFGSCPGGPTGLWTFPYP